MRLSAEALIGGREEPTCFWIKTIPQRNKTALDFPMRSCIAYICFSHRLCWPAQVCVGDAFGGFGVGLLDDVGVDIRGGGHGGVAEAF